MSTAAEKNIAAEARAVEAGHRAILDGSTIRVVSDTHHDKAYRVEAFDVGAGITFTCTPEGHRAYADDHLRATGSPGVVPCMHAALAARRLERAGLAVFVGGLWRASGLLDAINESKLAARRPEDPMEGLC